MTAPADNRVMTGSVPHATRLDTRGDLAEARQLYITNGYQEVAAFNDGRFADHWYGKLLS